jgi:hypothetical protein
LLARNTLHVDPVRVGAVSIVNVGKNLHSHKSTTNREKRFVHEQSMGKEKQKEDTDEGKRKP